MTEHPILFSGAMVRALLAGTKTQTRRVVKKNAAGRAARGGRNWHLDDPDAVKACPYGTLGDRLWVRETWNIARPTLMDGAHVEETETMGGTIPIKLPKGGWAVWYAADEIDPGAPLVDRYRPSIHMPRWASRITLEVTDVRVQRVQDLSEGDAKAEGMGVITKDGGRLWKYGIPDRDGYPGDDDDGWHWHEWEADPRKAYAKLWNTINGPVAWDLNPWVWAVSFRRVTP